MVKVADEAPKPVWLCSLISQGGGLVKFEVVSESKQEAYALALAWSTVNVKDVIPGTVRAVKGVSKEEVTSWTQTP